MMVLAVRAAVIASAQLRASSIVAAAACVAHNKNIFIHSLMERACIHIHTYSTYISQNTGLDYSYTHDNYVEDAMYL